MADAAAVAGQFKGGKKSSLVRKMSMKHKLLLITFSLLMMGLLRTGFVFFVIGMLPCIVAYYMDISKHRYTFQTIFAANLAGMMPFITKIIFTGPSSTLLQTIMGDSTTWVIIYGAAFIGWLLIKVCPMIAQVMVQGLHQTQIMRYDWLQKKLESEWGEEVKQMSDRH
jgi:hypothetical protein